MGANLLDGAGAIYDAAIVKEGGEPDDRPLAETAEEADGAEDKLAKLQADPADETVDEAPEAEGDEKPHADDGTVARSEELLGEIRDVLKALDEKSEVPPADEKPVDAREAKPTDEATVALDADLVEIVEENPSLEKWALTEQKRRIESDERIARLEADRNERVLAQAAEPFDAAIESLTKTYDLNELEVRGFVAAMTDESGGVPLTVQLADAARKALGAKLTPQKLASLVVEAGAERLFSADRLKVAQAKTDTAPKDGADGGERRVVRVSSQHPEKGTVETRGGSAGPRPAPEKVPANETMEQSIRRVGARLKW